MKSRVRGVVFRLGCRAGFQEGFNAAKIELLLSEGYLRLIEPGLDFREIHCHEQITFSDRLTENDRQFEDAAADLRGDVDRMAALDGADDLLGGGQTAPLNRFDAHGGGGKVRGGAGGGRV
jgi:hypothetical protein